MGIQLGRSPRVRSGTAPMSISLVDDPSDATGSRDRSPENPARVITRILAEARSRFGMDVAFVSEFTGGRRVFRFVEGRGEAIGVEVDGSDPLEETYCSRVVKGQIPCLVPDAQNEPGVADLPVTKALSIGAHVSVPIVFSDGRVYGTFCLFSQKPKENLEGHISTIRLLAELVTEQLEQEEMEAESRRVVSERIRDLLSPGRFQMVFQPIVELNSRTPIGVEALTRFAPEPRRTPDQWFEEAWSVGLGVELELAAARAARSVLPSLPTDSFLSINVSPETAISPKLLLLLIEQPCKRLVLELTEHSHVTDYEPLRAALDRIRRLGVRIAIDDVGTGYSGLRQLLELRPDILKLDQSITRGIDVDPTRRSLATSVANFAREMELTLVAEGVETPVEADVLAGLGVGLGQGYLFGRPQAA
jgi:EAL domain-containing protein (putative c-di-GMP-specific phosphodiesterase class I)